MKFQFEVPNEVAEAHTFLATRPAFFGLTPRLMTFALYMQALEREKQEITASMPKAPPPQKVSAEQRKLDERAARIEAHWAEKLTGYRATGKWPRVEMTSAAIAGWKAELIVDENGGIRFLDTELTAEGGSRSFPASEHFPPEDYPHMAEYVKALAHAERVMLVRSGVPVDLNAPKQADFVGEEGYPDFDAFQSAETQYQQAQFRGEIPY